MRKVNLFFMLVIAVSLMSCGSESTSVDSITDALQSDGTLYKYEFSSAEDFNIHVVDAIDDVIDTKENEILDAGEEVTGQELGKILDEYKKILTATVEKLENTKPYYEGENFLSSTLDYVKAKQKIANEVWTKVIDMIGEKKMSELTEEEANSIDAILTPGLDEEQQVLVIAQGFAAANNSYVEYTEE